MVGFGFGGFEAGRVKHFLQCFVTIIFKFPLTFVIPIFFLSVTSAFIKTKIHN